MSAIWLVIKEMLTSKKFIMSVASTAAAAALKIGLDLPVEDVAAILSPMIAYLLAQGWADRGKEAAKVNGTVSLALDSNNTMSVADNVPQPVKDKLL